MAVRIRLRRVGRKKQPSYRIVVADSAAPRDGNYIDALGFYNPRTKPAELRLDLEKADEWIGKGAEPSTTVASLIRKARNGGDATVGFYGADGAEMPEGGRKTRVSPPKAQKKKAAQDPSAETAEAEAPAESEAPVEAEAAAEADAVAEQAPEAEAAQQPASEGDVDAPEAEATDQPEASAGKDAPADGGADDQAAAEEAAGEESEKEG